jgi:DNA-binding FadR family transcriptional regulator
MSRYITGLVREPIQSSDQTTLRPADEPAPGGNESAPGRDGSVPGLGPLQLRQRYEHVADRIVADIRAGRLAPGDRLPSERDLARRLEVGRASVREAIAALQVAGMIETRPGSGSFVAAHAAERTREAHDSSPSDLLEARALLEPAVARLAAQRRRPDGEAEALLTEMERAAVEQDLAGWNDCDRRFHRRIAALTGNPVLLELADHVATVMDQPLWQRLRDDSIAVPGRTTIHLAEHRMIYEAIAEGDADAAALYATQHIRRVRRYMNLD